MFKNSWQQSIEQVRTVWFQDELAAICNETSMHPFKNKTSSAANQEQVSDFSAKMIMRIEDTLKG